MDVVSWHHVLYVIVVAAALGAFAAGVKEVNGRPFSWKRFCCRSFYRFVLSLAGTLLAWTITEDMKILGATAILISVSGVGENTLLDFLRTAIPFLVVPRDETENHRQAD